MIFSRGGRIVIATHNAGKLREMAALLSPYGLDAVSAGVLGLPEPEETASTFVGNARLKAHAAAAASGLPALADDSGVCVTALGGAPGIYSARWAERADGVRDFAAAMARVQAELGEARDRSARFVSVLCAAWPDGSDAVFEGEILGTLVWPPRGENGFGYDPMFAPETGDGRTFGEMSSAEKDSDNHRARAFALAIAGLGLTT